jgi:anti-sigma factor RsiW
MNEHVVDKLEAYLDGELGEPQVRQVEVHVAECPACRAELDELRRLSEVLQESPPPVGLMPPERFVASVGLKMPRRPVAPAWQRALDAGWKMAPAGLLSTYVYGRAVLGVSWLALTALDLGLGGPELAALLPAGPRQPWLSELSALPGGGLNDVGRALRVLIGSGGPLDWIPLAQWALMIVVGLLYWSWLASWWARREHRRLRVEVEVGQAKRE